MSCKIYVAGSSGEIPRVRAVQAALRELDVEITYDWTHDIERAIAAGIREAQMDDLDAREHAERDSEGIFAAHFVLGCAPSTPSRGYWWETGFVCGVMRTIHAVREQSAITGKLVRTLPRLVVAGPAARDSVFARWGSTKILSTDHAAVRYIADVGVGIDSASASEPLERALAHLDALNG